MSLPLFRTEGVLNAVEAKRKTLALFGLGSLGSLLCAEIAYEWGLLVLVDPDTLKIENIERHNLGLKYLGWNKAEAMRDWLITEKGVPASSIVAHATTDEEVLSQYQSINLVVCSIDDQVPCRRINDWCVSHDVPAIYGGVYPKGNGGETISIPYPKDVCYLCAEHSRGVQSLIPEGTGNYGVDVTRINAVDDHPVAVSALRKGISAIANDMAFAMFQILFPEGGDLQPTLLYHALDDWTQVLQLRVQTAELRAVAQYIGMRKRLQLVEDTIRLGPPNAHGLCTLEIRRDYWPKLITKWARCSKHGPSACWSAR